MSRYRLLRKTSFLRDIIRETPSVTADDLVQPFFVIDGKNKSQAIASMPGIVRHSVDRLLKTVAQFQKQGGKAVLLFGVVDSSQKNPKASAAYSKDSVAARAVRAIKKEFPQIIVFTDVCLCAYMDHGHCGVLKGEVIDNDASLEFLSRMALTHAEAGADFVAPSDMMDFRVKAIREALTQNGHENTGILSYAVKYASAFYGPFREAAASVPQSGDRKTYQMDPANKREALKEALKDIKEGADMVMVKPALAYLDVVHLLKEKTNVPVAAYNVSGEYSMVKAAAAKQWIDEKAVTSEILTSIKRAGADLIITYHAQEYLTWQKRK